MGIRSELGFTESPAGWDSVGEFLRAKYVANDAENKRRTSAELRKELYCDGGTQALKKLIGEVYRDKEVIRLRRAWAEHARFDNALKRIVNELSTVYSEPAKRTVSGKQNNDRYQNLIERVRLDELMRRANRYVNLFNEALVWFRVRAADMAHRRRHRSA